MEMKWGFGGIHDCGFGYSEEWNKDKCLRILWEIGEMGKE